MKKEQFLNILLLSLIFALGINLFFGSKNQQQNITPNQITIDAIQKTEKIPAALEFIISNTTENSVEFNNCENAIIRLNGVDISENLQNCESFTIPQNSVKNFSYAKDFELFQEKGTYEFKFQIGELEYNRNVDLEYKGGISKIFNALIFAPVYNLMAFLLKNLNYSLGFSIIILTIIIRFILLYPQHKMLVSQRKLQTVQPKIQKLQEKYKDDKQKLGLELLELYKREKVNPMGSCGLMLLQIPIFIVVYTIISQIMNSRNEFYVYEFLKPFHISDINSVFFGIDLLQTGGIIGFIVALIVGGTQFLQMKLSLPKVDNSVKKEEPKEKNDLQSMMPDPALLNKFMLYGMPAMLTIFTFITSTGIGLYWFIGSVFTIAQLLIINKIIKPRKEEKVEIISK